MSFLADFFEPRLAQSHSTVIIPLDDRVLRDSVPRGEQRVGQAMAFWLGLPQQVPQRVTEAVAATRAAWGSVC
jgi:hypothetical protein